MKKIDFVTTLIVLIASIALAIVVHAGPSQGPTGTVQQTPILVDPAISNTFSTDQIAMSSTAAIIKAAPASGHYRYAITVKNSGSNTVWIGSSNAVTKTNGFCLLPGQWYTFGSSYSAIYGICDTGLTSSVCYVEEGK